MIVHEKSFESNLLRSLQLAEQFLADLLGVNLLNFEAVTDIAHQSSTGGDQLSLNEEEILATLELKERTAEV